MSSITSKNVAKMSAAGSGKTWEICNEALEVVRQSNKRVLILSFTNRSIESVMNEIRKQNAGVLHPRIVVKTWYRFLLSDMIKPYQVEITGGKINYIITIDYSEQYYQINFNTRGSYSRYINSAKNVRSNQASELVVLLNQINSGKSVRRLEEIYSNIYFDEVQDLAGYDIDILKILMESMIAITCCGDNKQATFKTHVAKKNKKLTGKNIWDFFNYLVNMNLVQIQKNLSTRRFNYDICCFANLVYPAGDSISTIMKEATEHDGVFLIKEDDVEIYYNYFNPQILRYDSKTLVNRPCLNFGVCKGETFDRVLIYPNGPLKKFILNGIPLKSPEKYYVAVTRPKYSIAFVMKILPTDLSGYNKTTIFIGSNKIDALKYQCSTGNS